MTRIWVPIEPMGAPRPRVTRYGTYNDPKYTKYKQIISLISRPQCKVSEKPISMQIEFFFTIPKSWTKKKKESALWHTSKPDSDNLIKGVKDALNGIAYLDDAQVCSISATKKYSDRAGIMIEIEDIE